MKMNQKGSTAVLATALIPMLAVIAWILFHASTWATSRQAVKKICREEIYDLQSELAPIFNSIRGLNPEIRVLRKARKAQQAILKVSFGNAAAIAAAEAALLIIETSLEAIQVAQDLLFAQAALSIQRHKSVMKNKVTDWQELNSNEFWSMKIKTRFGQNEDLALEADRTDRGPPIYQLKEDFENEQRKSLIWQTSMTRRRKFFDEWIGTTEQKWSDECHVTLKKSLSPRDTMKPSFKKDRFS